MIETQEKLHVKYLEQMSSTISDVAKDLLNIDSDHKNRIYVVYIKDFETSIIDIGYEASNIRADVYIYIPPITDKSIKAVQQGKNHRWKRATETTKSAHTCIALDYECLRQEVTQHKGLERRDSWKSQIHQLKKNLSNLMTTVNIHNIPCTDVNVRELNYKVSVLQNTITSKDQDSTPNPQTEIHLLKKPSLSDNPSKEPTTQEGSPRE